MPRYFSVKEKDPLDSIIKNNEIVKHLRENGIDGFEINKILHDLQGLKFKMPVSIQVSKQQVNYAIRYTKCLINNPAIKQEEQKSLCAMYSRLYRLQQIIGKKQNEKAVYAFAQGDGNAKTRTQAIGLQVVALHKYILPFSKQNKRHQKPFMQKDVFRLIIELFEVVCGEKYTEAQIKNFYKNNYK